MKNTFILKLACVIIAIITSITLFACDTQEKGSETESVTDKATDKVTEEPTDADTESKTAESAVLESETESGLKKAKNFTVYDADGNKVWRNPELTKRVVEMVKKVYVEDKEMII